MLISTFLAVPAHAGQSGIDRGPGWLSDQPPSAAWAKRVRSSHGGAVERGRGGVFRKRLWFREGSPLDLATYPDRHRAPSYDLMVLDPLGEAVPPEPLYAREGVGLSFPMAEEGFYNAYLATHRVRDGVLHTEILKAEALKHSCGAGHDRRLTEARMPPRQARQIPFEVIRERLPDEDFHTRPASGDTLSFQVLYRGAPAAGAEVAMVSEHGWTRLVQADAQGRARFQMIRDDYPDWELFDKREEQPYLVTAALAVDEQGVHEGQAYAAVRYSGSLAGRYFPSPRDYQSYLYGLGVMLLALLLTGGGIYLYRLKAIRPMREGFDEAA